MEALKTGMLSVIESADGLCGSTVRKVVEDLEVLSPNQTAKVLAAVAQFQAFSFESVGS